MRIIEPKLWNSQKWRKKLNRVEIRYFWLYLLTCPASKSCGIFYLPIETMTVETKLSEEAIINYLHELEENAMITYNYDTEEILIYNIPKYNIIRLGKPMEDCIRSELSIVKDTNLIIKMIDYLEHYIKLRVNDKKINILTNILDIYNKSISISISITNESCHESTNDSLDWEELMSHMEDD